MIHHGNMMEVYGQMAWEIVSQFNQLDAKLSLDPPTPKATAQNVVKVAKILAGE